MSAKYKLMQALLAAYNGLSAPDQAACASAIKECLSALLPDQAVPGEAKGDVKDHPAKDAPKR